MQQNEARTQRALPKTLEVAGAGRCWQRSEQDENDLRQKWQNAQMKPRDLRRETKQKPDRISACSDSVCYVTAESSPKTTLTASWQSWLRSKPMRIHLSTRKQALHLPTSGKAIGHCMMCSWWHP